MVNLEKNEVNIEEVLIVNGYKKRVLEGGQVKENMLNGEDLLQKVANNTKENFKFAFEKNIHGFRYRPHE